MHGTWIGAHTKTKWLLLFSFRRLFFFYRSASRERQCSYARSVFVYICGLTCAISTEKTKTVFFSFGSFRYSTWLCSEVARTLSSQQWRWRLFTGIMFFFRRCAVGPPDHLCPFGAIFYNTFFTSHLVARASHWCLARHTVFWKQ